MQDGSKINTYELKDLETCRTYQQAIDEKAVSRTYLGILKTEECCRTFKKINLG